MPDGAVVAAGGVPHADAIRATAESVLAGPSFRLEQGGTDPGRSWLLEILARILGAVADAFRFMQGLPLVLRLLIAAVLAAILAVIVWQIVGSIIALAGGRRPGLPLPRRDDRSARPEDLEAESARAATAGDLVTAVRRLFQAALRRIEISRGRPWPRGLTDRDLAARSARNALGPPLAGFVDTLERAWYGDRPCTADDLETCRRHHERIVALVAEGLAREEPSARPTANAAARRGDATTEEATDALAT